MANPVVNFTTDRLAFGPYCRDLLPLYQRWINDFEVTRTLLLGMHPMTAEAEEAWFEEVSRATGNTAFTVYLREDHRPIGNTSLFAVDHQHGTAELGLLIGEKDCWNQGYGTEITRAMLDYGFSALGLHNIMLRVYAFNERGRRAYMKAGFRELGRRRQARRLGGMAYDIIYMDCLATELKGGLIRSTSGAGLQMGRSDASP